MKLLKLGGSVITNKRGRCEANLQNIQKLAKMLGNVWKKGMRDIVLVHGAGSFGHSLVLEYEIDNGIKNDEQRVGFEMTHTACVELSDKVVKALKKEGIEAIRISPRDIIRQKNKRISKFDKSGIENCLQEGKMPVLHGDMVPDEELGGSVCSGDQIMAYLAKGAEKIIMSTNVDGVMVDGKVVPKISASNYLEVIAHLKESDSPDVTGGMAGKIRELRAVGGKIYIVNALYPERIEALLEGKEAICTALEF
ncbi:uridylate kinase [Candidatus Micrarchaeota archaeon CG10_big_fil_rev_8_21_14_0_10_45_29]|nr:MAG: uridylate kinase [Candidatus Micrarchaeota archaeon CG10_big_fil_rev_8_21_14_0_10_45_29]